MSKPLAYEVMVSSTSVVFVEGAKNIQEACEMALRDFNKGDFSDTTASPTPLYTSEGVDSSRRHADVKVLVQPAKRGAP